MAKKKIYGFRTGNSLFYLAIVLSLLCLGILCVAFTFVPRLISNDLFCTNADSVYKTILANGEEWVANFPSASSAEPLRFYQENGLYYYVRADFIPNTNSMILFVITGTDRRGIHGSQGYIYLPTDMEVPSDWFDNYWVKRIDTKVYCYNDFVK